MIRFLSMLLPAPLAALLAALLAVPASAQSPASAGTPPPGAVAPASDYIVGEGDILKITIYGIAADSLVQVSQDGTVPIGQVGPVRVGGLTPKGAADAIAHAMKSGGILVDPYVSVLVQEYHSKTVYLLGNVAKSGEYPLDRSGLRLTDMLARAGAQLGTGAGTIRVTAADGAKNEYPTSQVLGGTLDVPVHAGDSIVVDLAASFYISGEVQRAGNYPMEPGLTVGRAVALAGGLTPRGSRTRVKVTRAGKDGTEATVKVKPGDAVKPRDLIVVGSRIF